jgi:hypothetical protein
MILLGNPQSYFSKLIVNKEIAVTRDVVQGRAITWNMNVGVTLIAPTRIGLALVKQWKLEFQRMNETYHPLFQTALKTVLYDPRRPNVTSMRIIPWTSTQTWADGIIHGCSMSLAQIPTLHEFRKLAREALAQGFDRPLILHLAWHGPLARKLDWLHLNNFTFGTQQGCLPGRRTLLYRNTDTLNAL